MSLRSPLCLFCHSPVCGSRYEPCICLGTFPSKTLSLKSLLSLKIQSCKTYITIDRITAVFRQNFTFFERSFDLNRLSKALIDHLDSFYNLNFRILLVSNHCVQLFELHYLLEFISSHL